MNKKEQIKVAVDKIKEKVSEKHIDFKMPVGGKITGRKSTLVATFYKSITPEFVPTKQQVADVLELFEMENDCKCVYCGGNWSEWDHFFSIVKKGGGPSGYVTEISNLVPCCGKCNQSKGNNHWKEWIEGSAKQSPTTRKVLDLKKKIHLLNRFEKTQKRRTIDYAKTLGASWDLHLSNLKIAVESLVTAEDHAMKLRSSIQAILRSEAAKSEPKA